MPLSNLIRPAEKHDLENLKEVIESSGLFPPELLEGMMADYFGANQANEIWLTRLEAGKPVAILFTAQEKLTDGTWNMYLIAVKKEFRGKGIGKELTGYVEAQLKAEGQRVLIVETSGLPEFELTRKFYKGCGYTREAVIRDFYRDGDDKVVFWKKL